MSEHSAPQPAPRQLDILGLLEHSDQYVYQGPGPGADFHATLTLWTRDPRACSSLSIQREVIKVFVSVNEAQLGTRAGRVLTSPLDS
jgi:hypothetical protein